MDIKTLCSNKWISLKEIQSPQHGIMGYVYSHETRCNGHIVSFLPYRKVEKTFTITTEFLVRCETTPCWEMIPIMSSFTGGIDKGDSPTDCVIKELKEEAGIIITDEKVISLGLSYGAKSSDSTYHLFAVDVTNCAVGELTFESELEKTSYNKWITESLFCQTAFMDPFVYVLKARLDNYNKVKE